MNYYERLEFSRIGSDKGRREKKRLRDAFRLKIKERGSDHCYSCGGTMTWCSCCETFSRNCCVDYGTCQCS